MSQLQNRAAWIHGGDARCHTRPPSPLRKYRLVLLGSPGAGKTTQAALLGEGLGACRLSTDDVLPAPRGAAFGDPGTPTGETDRFTRPGDLAPEELVVARLRQRHQCLRCEAGFVLDGFPRTVTQARSLDHLLQAEDLSLLAVIHYELPPTQIISRLRGRRVCAMCQGVFHLTQRPPQQADYCDHCGFKLYRKEEDDPNSIRLRLQWNQETVAPLLEFYRRQGLLLSISAHGTPEEIRDRTLTALAQSAAGGNDLAA